MNLYKAELPVYCSGEIEDLYSLFVFEKEEGRGIFGDANTYLKWRKVTIKELKNTMVQRTVKWYPKDSIQWGLILEVLDNFTLKIKQKNGDIVNRDITKIILLDTKSPECIKEDEYEITMDRLRNDRINEQKWNNSNSWYSGH